MIGQDFRTRCSAHTLNGYQVLNSDWNSMELATIQTRTHFFLRLLRILQRLVTHRSNKSLYLAIQFIDAVECLHDQFGWREDTRMYLFCNFRDRCIRHWLSWVGVSP